MPLMLFTNKALSNCVYRNNLFVGTADAYAFQNQAKATDCDYDYDGFAGGPFANFLKWNNVKYATLAEVREKSPIERHAVQVDSNGLFASAAKPPADENVEVTDAPDLRLPNGVDAIDAGQALPGFNDSATGKGPDLGAYELNAPLPHFGPRDK